MTELVDADVALFEQVLAGDADAADRFTRKYAQEVFAYCYRRLCHRERAEDASQEAFLKFWKSMRTIREPEKFRGFLYHIARNCCIDIHRSANNTERDDNLIDAGQELPSGLYAKKQLVAMIRTILEEFDETQKDAILLVHYQGLSYREVSEILGISIGTVKSKVSRGMLRLAQILKKRGIVQ
jgi:RNA polymerase sigma-70 factor, ECF subfamily